MIPFGLVPPTLEIPRLSGDPLKPWGGAGLRIVAMAARGPVLRPYREFGATARLAWTDEGLAAEIDVSDATPFASPDPERPYDGDSAELYLGLPGAGGMVQLVVSSRGRRFFDYRAPAQKRLPLAGRTALTRTEGGYVARLVVAWKSLGIRPARGLEIGGRVAANDGAPDRPREGLAWEADDFFALPRLRLGDRADVAPWAAAWGAARTDLTGVAVNVVAEGALAGREVRCGDQTAVLSADGPRAVARFELPVPPGGVPPEARVAVAGEPIRSLSLPDLAGLRRRAFREGAGPFRVEFTEGAPHLADPDFAARLVGPVDLRATLYDAEMRPVARMEGEGRYGAVVRLRSELAGEATVYRTLWRGVSRVDEKADRDWWHALRKRLGTAIRYETDLRFPDARDPTKRWPLIVYLHGSGGGDAGAWEGTRLHDGPMGYGAAHPGFPFATLALRSPGGWYPPAVRDAVEEAVATGRIDPDRIVLTGFSMGGIGTWAVTYDEPYRFAAIVPVGGRGGDPAQMPRLRQIPVWVFNGAEDEATLARDARSAVAALRAAGGRVRYTEIPRATHVDSLRIAYAKPELYAWMARQRRPVPPARASSG